MAIDTIQKLRSVPLIPGLPTFSVPPIADGTLDVDDFKHTTGFYRGIDYTGIVITKVNRGSDGLLLKVYNG